MSGVGSVDGRILVRGTYAGGLGLRASVARACRLVPVAALGAQVLQGGAKVGLIARGDLSDNSVFVMLDMDGPNGLHVGRPADPGHHAEPPDRHERRQPDQREFAARAELVGEAPLDEADPARQHVERVYIAGRRHVDAGGTSVESVEMAGCWVGVFVNNKNSSQPVQVVFDQLTGFTAGMFVRLGG